MVDEHWLMWLSPVRVGSIRRRPSCRHGPTKCYREHLNADKESAAFLCADTQDKFLGSWDEQQSPKD